MIAAACALAVVAALPPRGYWWLDGYDATREQYAAGIARTRPYGFFLFSNLAAFALATGPAVAIALGRLRDRRLWLLVGGGLAAVALADLSGMSKAEVERIWLPFLPWVLLATAAIRGTTARRDLLVAQAACAIVDPERRGDRLVSARAHPGHRRRRLHRLAHRRCAGRRPGAG